MDGNPPTVLLYYALADGQTEADTLHVVTCTHLKFAEVLEQLLLILFVYANSSVLDRHIQSFLVLKIINHCFNRALSGKLKRILSQVDQNLKETPLLTD